MRVDAYMQVNQLYQATKQKKTTKQDGSTSNTDTLEISDFGREYQLAKQATKSSDGVREDKVQDIQKQMASGSYNVSIEQVADKLADRLLGE